jgi:hypothetical protein
MMATALGWVFGRILLPSLATVVIGLSMGALQWLLLKSRVKNAWLWIVATSFGWALGSFLILLLLPEELDLFGGMILGLTTGIAQWLVLREVLRMAGWWIVVSLVAWTSGMALLPGLFLTGVVAGLILATGITLLLNFERSDELPQTEGEL